MSEYRVLTHDEFAAVDVWTVHVDGLYRVEVSYGTGDVDYDEFWPTPEAALARHERVVAEVRDRGYVSSSHTRACPSCGVNAYYGTDEWGRCGACRYAGTQPDEENG